MSARATRQLLAAILCFIHLVFTAYSAAPRARRDLLQNAPFPPPQGRHGASRGLQTPPNILFTYSFIQGWSGTHVISHEISFFAMSTAFTTYPTE